VDAQPVPALEDRAPTYQTRVPVGNLTLLGYDLLPGPYQPGSDVTPRLYWQVNGTIAADYDVTARLLTDQGDVVQSQTTRLGPPGYPTSHWERGRSVATFVDVPVAPRATTGSYHLSLTVAGPGLDATTLSDFPDVKVVARDRQFVVPTIPHPRQANFGGQIDLLGYDLQETAITQGGKPTQLQLTLYWRDQQPIGNDYKVFTHLVGSDGKIYGQDDSIPLDGQAPTIGWVPGEVLVDHYDLNLRQDTPNGRYTLMVGFYDPESGERLPLEDHAGDSFVVTTVDVQG
jgi:hypothetical protein